MATYRLEAKIIGRSSGRSATASAAYRSGGKLEDERTGAVFDYSRMRGVLHSEIIAPDNTPEWMRDRSQLWNAVEAAEKRKDAQLARDLVLSLPHELTHDQRVELARDFVRSEFVDKGMVADISIHAPDRQGDGFGKKVREWNGTDQLEQWREHWAVTVNQHLERAGFDARVDHRSLADQGIDREPEPKQGPIATEMERAGRPSHAGDDRRAAQERNNERAAIDAELRSITSQIIDLDEERAKRASQERGSTQDHPVMVATDDAGMVAQEREAMRLASLRKKLSFHEDGPQQQQGRAGDIGTPADDRAKRFQEQLEQNFPKPGDDRDRGRTR
jgi:ATP-dependent exoDNAse (exonuclease V) alpha subunit